MLCHNLRKKTFLYTDKFRHYSHKMFEYNCGTHTVKKKGQSEHWIQ